VEKKELEVKSTVARLLVQFFKEAGVRHIFGVSGHSVFDITDALYGDPEIPVRTGDA
jgi:thiamine pyrophosphate-dependent acetolactate synthase large subunit-like protein